MAHKTDVTPEPDATEGLAGDEGTAAPRADRLLWTLVLALLLVGMLAAGGAGYLLRGSGSSPGDEGPEAGFARDMQVHHAQAVEMSLIVHEKSKDPVLRAMAYDVITSQQQQIGQMYAWLDGWGLSQTSSSPPMAWMSEMDHSEMGSMASGSTKLLPDGRMPGMASAAQVARLRSAGGREAEILWLQLMIPHHQAGVTMAEAVIQESGDPQVVKLASAIRTAQLAEIEQMRQMLIERGADEKN